MFLFLCSMTFCLFLFCIQPAIPYTHTDTQNPNGACIQILSALAVMDYLAVVRLRHNLSPWQHMMMSTCSKVFVCMCVFIFLCVHLLVSLSVCFRYSSQKDTHGLCCFVCLLSSLLMSSFFVCLFFCQHQNVEHSNLMTTG